MNIYSYLLFSYASERTIINHICSNVHNLHKSNMAEKSESESESFYSVLLQTQETSAKTISGRCRRGHLEKSIHECMYVTIILINKYYYRPRRPLLRPYLVAVAEATRKKVYMNVCM